MVAGHPYLQEVHCWGKKLYAYCGCIFFYVDRQTLCESFYENLCGVNYNDRLYYPLYTL